MFLKERKYIEKEKVIRHIIDDLQSSDDDSDEEYVKAKYEDIFLKEAILKMHFLKEQF